MEATRVWTTKEKLAVACCVLRFGDAEWGGLSQLLTSILYDRSSSAHGTPPNISAEQFKALLDGFGLVDSSHEKQVALVDDLTQARVNELKEQLERQRKEYEELEREILLVQSGARDHKLDELLKKCERVDDAINNNADTETGDAKEDVSSNAVIKSHPEELASGSQVTQDDVSSEKQVARNIETPYNGSPMTEVIKFDNAPTEAELDVPEKSLYTSDMTIGSDITSKESAMNSTIESDLQDPQESQNMKDVKASDCSSETNQNNMTTVNEQVSSRGEDVDAEATLDSLEKDETIAEEIMPSEDKEDLNPFFQKSPRGDESCDELVEENESVCNDLVDALEDSNPDITPQNSPTTDSKPMYEEKKNQPNPQADFTENANRKAWKKSTMILWKQIASHRNAPLFLQRVTDDIAPNYSSTVYRAMDLSSLKRNVENGVIRTTSEFQRDLMLMFQNALMYNNKEHTVYKMAEEMQSDVMDQVAQFLATQIMVDSAQPPSVIHADSQKLPQGDVVYATSDMLLSVLVSEARSKRVAAIEGEARLTRKKMPSHEP